MRENADQNNSEHGHFSRSVYYASFGWLISFCKDNACSMLGSGFKSFVLERCIWNPKGLMKLLIIYHLDSLFMKTTCHVNFLRRFTVACYANIWFIL